MEAIGRPAQIRLLLGRPDEIAACLRTVQAGRSLADPSLYRWGLLDARRLSELNEALLLAREGQSLPLG